MKLYLVSVLIKLLVWLLDVPRIPRDAQIDAWLAAAWQTPGFRKYIAFRNHRIVDELAGGAGLKERTREDYIRFTGQRLENLIMGNLAKKAHAAKEKDDRRRMKDAALSTPPSPETT